MRKTILFSFAILFYLVFLSSNSNAKDSVETAGDALLVVIPSSVYATTFFIDDEEGRYQFYKSWHNFCSKIYD